MNTLERKYGIQKLEIAPEKRHIDLDQINRPSTTSKYFTDRQNELKAKFRMDGLILENAVAKPKEETVEDFVNGKERDSIKNMKLCFGRTTYNGAPLKVWFDISR